MFYNNEKVLVTGGAGLVGGNLIKRLLADGADIRATIHNSPPVVNDNRVEYVKCDLTQREECKQVTDGMRYVFSCAENSSGAAAVSQNPMSFVVPNVLINVQMLEAAYAAGVEKFLWLSSTVGYPPLDHPMQEDEMFNGEPYEKYFFVGWLKRFSETLCCMYGEKLAKPMKTVVLRPTSVYGIGDDFEFETSHVIPALIRKVVERWDPLEVWGTGDDVRDLIYIDDLIDAMVMAMEKVDDYQPMNIGLGEGYTVKEILNMILELDGYDDAKIVFNSSKPSMIPKRLVDTTKAQDVLGFKAKVGIREGLQKTIAWYRSTLESKGQ